MNLEDFRKHVLTGVRPASEPFTPAARYDPDGDCIEFLAVAESYYGERIDDLVTVFYSHRTGEIVGSLIKGVKSHLRKYPNLVVSVDDGKIRIDHLLISKAMAGKPLESVAIRTYQRLVKVAEETNAVAEVAELCEA
jgi:hypothetical protein